MDMETWRYNMRHGGDVTKIQSTDEFFFSMSPIDLSALFGVETSKVG